MFQFLLEPGLEPTGPKIGVVTEHGMDALRQVLACFLADGGGKPIALQGVLDPLPPFFVLMAVADEGVVGVGLVVVHGVVVEIIGCRWSFAVQDLPHDPSKAGVKPVGSVGCAGGGPLGKGERDVARLREPVGGGRSASRWRG